MREDSKPKPVESDGEAGQSTLWGLLGSFISSKVKPFLAILLSLSLISCPMLSNQEKKKDDKRKKFDVQAIEVSAMHVINKQRGLKRGILIEFFVYYSKRKKSPNDSDNHLSYLIKSGFVTIEEDYEYVLTAKGKQVLSESEHILSKDLEIIQDFLDILGGKNE